MKYDEFVIETIRLLLVLIPSMQKAIWAARDYIEELENSCGVGYRQ